MNAANRHWQCACSGCRGMNAAARFGITLALVGAVSLPAHASITLCNRSDSTLEYVMVRNDWTFGANFMPQQHWYADGWYQLPPGCTTVIDEMKLLHVFFLIQERAGKTWRTLRYSVKDPNLGQHLGEGATGTDERFCVSSAKIWRRAQNLDDLAACTKGQRLETFSLYVKTHADTEHTIELK